MSRAAEALDFERAARLRDRISALSAISGEQSVNPRSIPEADVFAITEEAGQYCVEVFFFRTYQNWGNRAYFPRADRALGSEEVLDAFLAQFYLERPAPRLVLLSHPVASAAMLCEVLSARIGRRIAIGVPRRGEKRDLVDAAMRNAREALSRKLAETASQGKLLVALAQAFGIEKPLRRVEIYDNSHIMGTNAIGAMVVAGPDGFVKNAYRTFNIKSVDLTPGDDYAMMREVLTRRFARLDAARRNGGRRRLPRHARPRHHRRRPGPVRGRARSDGALGVEGVALASIAKGPDRNAGRETFFVEGREPFRLSPRDPALFFVQRLRDEAHRFAIGTHRARRKKDFVKSPLDEIPGVGPARKRALLHAFGSAKAVARAGLADLEKTPGLNAATAKIVYEFFHEAGGAERQLRRRSSPERRQRAVSAGDRVGRGKRQQTHAHRLFRGRRHAADIPRRTRRVGADDEEISTRFEPAMAGSHRKDNDVPGVDLDLDPAGPAEHELRPAARERQRFVSGRMVVMIAINAVAPGGRPIVALKQGFERRGQVDLILAYAHASIDEDRQTRVVRHPTVRPQMDVFCAFREIDRKRPHCRQIRSSGHLALLPAEGQRPRMPAAYGACKAEVWRSAPRRRYAAKMLEGLPPNNAAHRLTLITDDGAPARSRT